MRLLIAGLGDGGDPRHQAADRRERVELRRVQARDQHRRRRSAATTRASSRTATRTSTGNELGLIARDRRIADRRHQDDEVGDERRSIRLLLAGGRRHARLPDGERIDAEGVRHRTGNELWPQALGTVQKAPPVLADGKLYVGNDNGKFFIIRPRVDKRGRFESKSQLPISTNSCCSEEGVNEQILAGAAVSRGRDLLCLERCRLCDWREPRDDTDRSGGRRAGRFAAAGRRPRCTSHPPNSR